MQIQILLTFDLLFIPEPAQVSGRLAALGHAGQGDVVSLLGRLCQAIDLWLLRYTCRKERKSQQWNYFTRSGVSLCNSNIIMPYWRLSSSSPSCREIRARSTQQHPWERHQRGMSLTHGWMVSLATGPSPPLTAASHQLQNTRTSSGV